jgi:hypothetical protein
MEFTEVKTPSALKRARTDSGAGQYETELMGENAEHGFSDEFEEKFSAEDAISFLDDIGVIGSFSNMKSRQDIIDFCQEGRLRLDDLLYQMAVKIKDVLQSEFNFVCTVQE